MQPPADADPAGDEGGIPHLPAPPAGAGVEGRSDKTAEPYGSIFTGKLAKHAEVVLIRDLCGKIKMSVGLYPLDSERGHAMADLALEVIAELTYAGLNRVCQALEGIVACQVATDIKQSRECSSCPKSPVNSRNNPSKFEGY